MTLVLAAHSRRTLWVAVDRRLSYSDGGPFIDDAVKVVSLETVDGQGLLAYAGLGATARGTQPSAWINSVLRGHNTLKFEHALRILSDAANRQLPPHLKQLAQDGTAEHHIIVPAFLNKDRARMYSIDNVIDLKHGRSMYRFSTHQHSADPCSPAINLALAGTGGLLLTEDQTWMREFRYLMKKHSQGRIDEVIVADYLAQLNARVHSQERTVGPRCIVVWRHRAGGGAQRYYTHGEVESSSPGIPSISNGMDVMAIATTYMNELKRQGWGIDHPGEIDLQAVQERIAQLPTHPDDLLL